MTKLLTIQDTAQAVAEAITAAIELQTEIVDDELNIVAGTGSYYKKIGQIEEGGDLNSGEICALVITTRKEYIIDDPNDPIYLPVEGELGEVCCPIIINNKAIGLISLVAFNEDEKKKILNKAESLLNFARKMAFLLASKVLEVEMSNKIKIILESINEGIISVDKYGVITSCNAMAENLIGKSKEELIGRYLKEFWVNSPIMDVIHSGVGYKDNEEIYSVSSENQMHYITTASPLGINMQRDQYASREKCIGAVISFRDIRDVRKMVYDMTERNISSSINDFIGSSPQILNLKKTVQQIANGKSTILITGESGTGKGLLAEMIHFNSPRQDAPFITVNCGAIPDNLIESEMFGYDAGAFTGSKKNGKPGKFELADKGTIFLDEIGDLPLHLQVKLLHVIQKQKFERVGGTREISVDVRIIAATNCNLEQMVADKEFRKDLYFRLNVIPMHIPPLRERKEDILILLERTLDRYNKLLDKQIEGFDYDVMQLLLNYNWPGNVREIENVVEYAVNMENSDMITINSFPAKLRLEHKTQDSVLPLDLQCKELEKRIITETLKEIGYSVVQKRKAAKILGISESSLYRKMRELKIKL